MTIPIWRSVTPSCIAGSSIAKRHCRNCLGGVNKQTGPFNGRVMKPILWPQGGQPVRVSGVNKVNAGDIIGFFDEQNGDLVHSMVAETPTQWVGANNTGCFGVPTGRTTIPNVYLVMPTPTAPVGW